LREKPTAAYRNLLGKGTASAASEGLTLDLNGFGSFVGKRQK
jgi:hypothetical protein